ncbi:hypothetical protein BU202_02355 [Streptococcus cuniculi]|uniref:DUF624 domain-containing protein n=1 Tax=Streptococcus cuniculi TaxID=1432788 RepID=A0A1Q8E9L4_9STRE|nr:YesL family protein [Streptococcus cuniculi]OLF48478.1 hypothetical protein BU202_02355 [Streptococcus cuniculi]
MKRLFDPENPVMQFLAKVFNLMWLNLLVVLTSFPIFTIGTSLTAMSYVLFRMIEGDDTAIFKTFFHAFQQNLKQTVVMTGLFLLSVVAGATLIFVYGSTYFVLKVVGYAWIGYSTVIVLYLIAIISRYETSLEHHLLNAVKLVIAFAPRTIGIMALLLGYVMVCQVFFRILAPVIFLLGVTLPSCIITLIMKDMFELLENS